jgi:shikimate kinase
MSDSTSDEATDHWVLIGLMGSGKSTVGELLARRSGRPYVDNDDALQALTGRTAQQLQDEVGGDRLHELEVEALEAALDDSEPAVIGAAAGVVTLPEGLRQLERARQVIWLQADPEVLAERVLEGDDHRPLGDDAVQTLATQLSDRAEAYESVATVAIDEGRSPEEIADAILAAVRE